MTEPVSAELFPVGEHLADELEARGWTQVDFAQILGRPIQFVSEIVSGKKEITRESAAQIATALGTSPELWLNLQDSYLLWKQGQDDRVRETLDAVRVRARLRELVPVPLLMSRGYLPADDIDDQASHVLTLLGMQSLDDSPDVVAAARRSNPGEDMTTVQRAWVACVRACARDLEVSRYDHEGLRALAVRLSSLARDPAAFLDFPSLFGRVGVKVVYVEAFPGGKLDGCAMFVDGSPVIGLSGRRKRLDIVLFTLLHEVSHVLLGHVDNSGRVIIDDLSESGHDCEGDADALAGKFALPQGLTDVPARPHKQWIQGKADELGVHPIMIVGRLQKQGILSWKSTLAAGAPQVTTYLQQWGRRLRADSRSPRLMGD